MEIDRDPAGRAAQQELTAPRYEHRTWWDDLMSRAGEKPGNHRTPDLPSDSSWSGDLMPLLVAVVLVVLVVIAAFYARKALRGARSKTLFEDEEALLSSAQEHRQKAGEAVAAGDWARAVAEQTRAVVKDLDERGVLALTPGRTADEFAFLAGGILPGLAAGLAEAASAFDAVVYGGQPGSQESYLAVLRLAESVPSAVRALGKATAQTAGAQAEELVAAGKAGMAW